MDTNENQMDVIAAQILLLCYYTQAVVITFPVIRRHRLFIFVFELWGFFFIFMYIGMELELSRCSNN